MQAAQILKQQHPELFFVIPTVKTVAQRVKAMLANAALPVLVVEGEEDRHNAMSASTAAIADVPHVIGYKVAPLTAALVKHFLHIQFVNLSNILLGREIVPELLQERCVAANIVLYINRFLEQDSFYRYQKEGFEKVRTILGLGRQKPSENAADVVLGMIRRKEEA